MGIIIIVYKKMEQKSNDNVDFQSSLTICLRNLK